MLNIKFRGNQPARSREEIFLRVFTIYGPGGQLGHVTSIMPSDFHFLVPESFHKKIVQIGAVVSEKIRFEFLYVHDLGPNSSSFVPFHWCIALQKQVLVVWSPVLILNTSN